MCTGVARPLDVGIGSQSKNVLSGLQTMWQMPHLAHRPVVPELPRLGGNQPPSAIWGPSSTGRIYCLSINAAGQESSPKA